MRSLRWAVPIAVGAVLVLAAPAVAATVQIQDDANVLDATNVQNEAARLPVDIVIWTSRQPMSNGQFDTQVAQKVSPQFPIAMGINVAQKHETIQMGPVEGLSQSARISAEDSANNAFASVMRSRDDYTGAIQAAVSSLNSSLGARGPVNSGRSGSHGSSWGVLVVILVILVVVVAVLGRVFRRFGRGGGRGYGGPPPAGYGPAGPYGPNYGPGYGPGYGGGGGGIGRGGAAGLGALGGGLVGYELGKMAGENEQFRRDEMMGGGVNQGWDNNNQGWNGDQGWGGGDQGGIVGQDSDWGGGGGGGDFGGGGGDNSGGNW